MLGDHAMYQPLIPIISWAIRTSKYHHTLIVSRDQQVEMINGFFLSFWQMQYPVDERAYEEYCEIVGRECPKPIQNYRW